MSGKGQRIDKFNRSNVRIGYPNPSEGDEGEILFRYSASKGMFMFYKYNGRWYASPMDIYPEDFKSAEERVDDNQSVINAIRESRDKNALYKPSYPNQNDKGIYVEYDTGHARAVKAFKLDRLIESFTTDSGAVGDGMLILDTELNLPTAKEGVTPTFTGIKLNIKTTDVAGYSTAPSLLEIDSTSSGDVKTAIMKIETDGSIKIQTPAKEASGDGDTKILMVTDDVPAVIKYRKASEIGGDSGIIEISETVPTVASDFTYGPGGLMWVNTPASGGKNIYGLNSDSTSIMKWEGAESTSLNFSLNTFSQTETGFTGTQLIGPAGNDWKADGDLIFTASYNNGPPDATPFITMAGSSASWAANLEMTSGGGTYEGPTATTEAIKYPTNAGSYIQLTLSATKGGIGPLTTSVNSGTFRNRFCWGAYVTNNFSAFSESNKRLVIDDLHSDNASTTDTIATTKTINIDNTHFLAFAYRTALSNIKMVYCGTGDEKITVAMKHSDATEDTPLLTEVDDWENSLTKTEDYVIIASKENTITLNAHSTSFTTSQSASPVLSNFRYWGEVDVDSGADGAEVYTSANVEDNINATASQSNSPNDIGRQANYGVNFGTESFTFHATGSQYVYFAYPSRQGVVTGITIDGGATPSLSDFWVDHGVGSELIMTNPCGFQEPYYVYVSKNPGWDSGTYITVVV